MSGAVFTPAQLPESKLIPPAGNITNDAAYEYGEREWLKDGEQRASSRRWRPPRHRVGREKKLLMSPRIDS